MDVVFKNLNFEISLNVFSSINLIYISNSNLAYSDEKIEMTITSEKGHTGRFFQVDRKVFENISVAENIFISNYPRKFFNLFIDKKKILSESEKILNIFGLSSILKKNISELSKEELFVLKLSSFYKEIKNDKLVVFPASIDLYDKSIKKYFKLFLEHLVKENKRVFIFTSSFDFEEYRMEFLINFINDSGDLKYISSKVFLNNPRYFENFILNKNIHKSLFSSLDELGNENDISSLKEKINIEAKKLFSCDACFAVFFDRDNHKNSLYDNSNYVILKNEHLDSDSLKIFNSRDFIGENIKCSSRINTIIINPIFSKKKHIGSLVMLYKINLFPSLQGRQLIYERFKTPLKLFSRHISIFLENTTTSSNHLILNEAHHRIKNNLQSIVNLVEVEKSIATSEDTIEVLNKVTNRINSISLIHKKLCYKSNYAETLNLKEIIEDLIKLHEGFLKGVETELSLKDYYYPYNKVVSLSLAFSEIISNSIKYSFNDPTIVSKFIIKMFSTFNYYYFIIQDRGSVNIPRESSKDSFGLSLIKGLIGHDLKGEFTFEIYENSSKALIKIPKH